MSHKKSQPLNDEAMEMAADAADTALSLTPTRGPRSLAPRQPWMCRARSSRTGELCTKAAIKGGSVCATHGGAAPAVKAAAKARLEAMLPKAQNALEELLDQTEHMPARLGAVKEVHDRVLGKLGGAVAPTDTRPIIQLGVVFTRAATEALGDAVFVEGALLEPPADPETD